MALIVMPLSERCVLLHTHLMRSTNAGPILPGCSIAAGMRLGPGYLALFMASIL